MSRFAFVGGAYKSQSFAADQQSCINLMVEKDESGAGKSDVILVNTPGLAVAYQLPDAPLRGEFHISEPGVLPQSFAVSGSTLFELINLGAGVVGTVANGGVINRGGVPNDGKPACFASSNIQLMVASGGQGFCYTLATQTLSAPIATVAGVVKFVYIDGFFIAQIGNSAQFFVSNPEDGVDWDASQTAIVSVFPDNVISLDTILRTLCLFGKKKSVCYYDSGGNGVDTFPFDVVPGGTSEQGVAATFGQVPADNTIFGIWQDDKGSGVAFRANGYTFQRISTHAIENEWQHYPKISDAIASSYQDGGHLIVQWTFPSANKGNGTTWCFDISTGLWFEKAHYVNGVKKAHPSAFHMFAFDRHLVGDMNSGNIYQMSTPQPDGLGGWLFADDFGSAIIRERTSPYVGEDSGYTYFNTFEVLADAGLGPNIPLADGSGNFRGPQLMLSWSNDLGKTWEGNRFIDMGQIGQRDTRMRETRLGRCWGSTGRIWRLTFSDAAPLRIVDVVVDPPIKRLAQRLREQA